MRTSRALAFALIAVGCSSPSSPGGSRSVEPSGATSATTTSVAVDDRLPELPADAREAQLAKNIERLLSKEHVRGQVVGDAVSKDAFPKYLEELDGGKLFLLASDVRALSAYAEKMDDELRDGDLTLARKGGAVLKQRRVVVAKIVADLLAKPLDFTADEKIESDPKKVQWAADDSELTDRWRKFLKMQALERITQLEETAEAQAKKTPKKDEPAPVKPLVIPPTFEGKEEKARTELAASYAGRFTRMADMESLEPAEKFINAVASVYDPHTLYMPPAEKENFDIQISGSLEGIGAALGEEDHYIVVRDLIPGGASWSQGKLEVGDLILAVAQQGKDPIDVTDMPIDKVVKMVRGPKGTLVTLTVKKADGHTENISITRDVVRIEASYARGATLDRGPKSDAVGYVYLPGFYGDTRSGATGPGERNATGDVRKLLEKFQKQKLGTVIIDLRGNGGGLLGHARDITGLLIDTGPVVQTKSSDGEIGVLEDTDKGVAFTGDVVVMVDRFSASASEILAGALQDYQRAVIVGTGPTHGKGTVQTLVDLDRMRGNAPTKDSMGVFKLTIEQYYRVNGDSTQWRGVVPDIVMPDPASYVDSGERSLEHSIPWSKVEPLKFKTVAHKWDLTGLTAASAKRVTAEPAFGKIEAFAKILKEQRKTTQFSLKRDVWSAERKKDKELLDSVRPKLDEGKARFEVVPVDDPTVAPRPGEKPNDKVKGRLDKWRDDLARDPWLEEALRVAEDMRPATNVAASPAAKK